MIESLVVNQVFVVELQLQAVALALPEQLGWWRNPGNAFDDALDSQGNQLTLTGSYGEGVERRRRDWSCEGVCTMLLMSWFEMTRLSARADLNLEYIFQPKSDGVLLDDLHMIRQKKGGEVSF